jgi:hypothetical protein
VTAEFKPAVRAVERSDWNRIPETVNEQHKESAVQYFPVKTFTETQNATTYNGSSPNTNPMTSVFPVTIIASQPFLKPFARRLKKYCHKPDIILRVNSARDLIQASAHLMSVTKENSNCDRYAETFHIRREGA